jgi:hypothetical protein
MQVSLVPLQIQPTQLNGIKVYDVQGREIKTLVNRVQTPGQYTVTFDARNLASGVYLYRLRAGNLIATRKLMLLK